MRRDGSIEARVLKGGCRGRQIAGSHRAQISEGGIGGGLSLPKAVFEVHDTIRIASVRGFKLGGHAPLATDLRWLGPADRTMFDIDRCQDILLEDFSISVGAGKQLLAAAWIQNGVGATGPKAAPSLERARTCRGGTSSFGDRGTSLAAFT
jgi:hypothetical protein